MIPRSNPIPALLDFIAAWVPGLSSRHRIDPSLIPKFVPPPLRAIYEATGNYPVPYNKQWRQPNWIPGLFGPQDQLLPIDKLQVRGDRFTFLHENQGVWSCETLTEGEDPPVYSDSLACETGNEDVQEVCSSLSHFLATYCLQELTFGSQHLFCVDSKIRAPEDLVKAELHPVWVNGVYVSGEPSHSFYACSKRILVMSTWGEYWIAYNDGAASELVNSSAHEIRRIH